MLSHSDWWVPKDETKRLVGPEGRDKEIGGSRRTRQRDWWVPKDETKRLGGPEGRDKEIGGSRRTRQRDWWVPKDETKRLVGPAGRDKEIGGSRRTRQRAHYSLSLSHPVLSITVRFCRTVKIAACGMISDCLSAGRKHVAELYSRFYFGEVIASGKHAAQTAKVKQNGGLTDSNDFVFFRLTLCFTHLFITKLGMALQHHEPECHAKKNGLLSFKVKVTAYIIKL